MTFELSASMTAERLWEMWHWPYCHYQLQRWET